MDFICLDKEYANPIWLNPVNIQWKARHYECGEFSIQIRTEEYEPGFTYVYCDEREDMGIIQSIYQQKTIKGKFTQLSGFFLERLLHDYRINETVSCVNKNICEYAVEIITKFVDQDKFVIDDYSEITDTITSQITEGYLDNVLFELLKTRKIAYRIYYDFKNDELHFKFVKGKNRTQSQSENNTITFSEELKNLSNIEYKTDDSNYKNYAYVTGGDSEIEPTKIIVDIRADGERRKEICVDASDIKKEEGISQSEFEEQLKLRGREELSKYNKIQNITFDVDNSLVKYIEDYNRGDMADVIISDMQAAYESEIVEVDEVLKANKHTISLILGDKIPVKYVRRQ